MSSTVSTLDDFERFVFVMTVLEGYSEHEHALLLNCSIQGASSAHPSA